MAGQRNAFCIAAPVTGFTQEFFIDKIGENNTALSDAQVETLQAHARRKLDQVFNYAYRSRCRRRAILDYFGDSTAVTRCVVRRLPWRCSHRAARRKRVIAE